MPLIRFKNQNYDKLKNKCISEKKLFVDNLFPANDSSLFNQRRIPGIEWKRPHELCSNPKLVVDGTSSRDVIQGQLGNCWFVAASAVLASEKKHWEKVVVDAGNQEFDPKHPENYAGIFRFRFWQCGSWTEVVIDDLLPTRYNRLLFTHSSSRNEFWSSLMEKAYAKLNGCYEHLDGGNLSEALQDFSGGVCESIPLDKGNLRDKSSTQADNLFDTMKKAYERNSLMACAINVKSSREMEEKLPCGLVKGHAYGITKINVMTIKGNSFFGFLSSKEKLHMVRLKNPWGSSEWIGPWSDKSEYWNKVPKSERERMGLNFDDDGEFWMEFCDFLFYFNELCICRLINTSILSIRKTWSESVAFGKWSLPNRAGGCINYKGTFCDNPQYIFEIDNTDRPDEVLINLDQSSMRNIGKNNLTIGFFIMKVEENRKYRLHQPKPKFISSTFINSRSVFLRHKFPTGVYVCIPSTYEPQIEGEFLLRVYSDDNNHLRELTKDCPVPLFPRCNPFAKYASCVTSLTVKSAFNLKDPRSNGGFDSYVCIKCEGKQIIGRIVRNSLSPEWDTSAIFYRYKKNQPIIVEVWLKYALSSEFYGQASLAALPDNRHIIIETDLFGKKDESKSKKPGRISIEIQSMSNITAI